MTNIFKIQAVLYDMDGILVDSEAFWEASEKEAINSYGADYDELRRKNNIVTTGMRTDQAMDLYCKVAPQLSAYKQEMMDRTINNTIAKIVKFKPIFPGVKESITLCRGLGLKVGLASSSPMKVIDAVTDCLGLTDMFDIRVSAEPLPYGKPHPGVYLLAAEKLTINPLNCITIEDSVAGMISTKAAQMKSIVIPAPEARKDPRWCLADYQLNSLLELSAKHLS